MVTNQVSIAFDSFQGGKTTIGTVIFLTAGLNADKETTKASSPFADEWEEVVGDRDPYFTDTVREPYLLGKKDYKNLLQVREDFHAGNFNYLVGFVSVILLLLVLSGAIMVFIRRLFELLLLYIVSPLFVSTIPLDDGTMFAKWRELFVSRFFSGFGIIFMMKYYMMLIPVISGKDLVLYNADLPDAVMINNVLKALMIIGGAWAVYKSQHLLKHPGKHHVQEPASDHAGDESGGSHGRPAGLCHADWYDHRCGHHGSQRGYGGSYGRSQCSHGRPGEGGGCGRKGGRHGGKGSRRRGKGGRLG